MKLRCDNETCRTEFHLHPSNYLKRPQTNRCPRCGTRGTPIEDRIFEDLDMVDTLLAKEEVTA